jgi:hypothetical protein
MIRLIRVKPDMIIDERIMPERSGLAEGGAADTAAA